jgi:2,5-diketo-D-gluconate reductase A
MTIPGPADLPGFPAITLGTMAIAPEQTVAAVHQAIELGYRSFDTSPIYGNEENVGEAIRTASIDRNELFVTTKLWNSCHGLDEALHAFDRTQQRLGLEVVDLYLIHWPVPTLGRYIETWRAMVRLKNDGRVRAIGVSNFLPEHLDQIVDATGEVPCVNQIECHPTFQQTTLREYHQAMGIVTQAWSSLGHGTDLTDPVVQGIARERGASPAQVILSWHLHQGVLPVVKASSPGHMAENLDARTINLNQHEITQIASLERNDSCFGVDPRTFVAPEGLEHFHP